MVTAGQVRHEDREGNNAADSAADAGVALFEADLINLSDHFAARQAGYTRLLRQLTHHITFTYRVRAALIHHHNQTPHPHQPHNTSTASTLQPKPKPTNPAIAPTYHAPSSPHPPHYYHINQPITIQQCPRALAKHPASTEVQEFLLNMPILDHRKGKGGKGFTGAMGITWLELYVLFRLAGYDNPIPVDSTSATARPNLQKQLHCFRAALQQVVHLTCSPTDQWLTKGKEVAQHRLQGLGITTYLTVLPWQPHLTPTTQHQVAVEILKSQHGLTHVKAMAALQTQTSLHGNRLLLKGRTSWTRAIKPTPHALYPPPPAPQHHQYPHHLPQGRGGSADPGNNTLERSDTADSNHNHRHTTTNRTATATSPPATTSTPASTSPTDFQGFHGRGETADPGEAQPLTPPTRARQGEPPPGPSVVFFQCPKCPHKLMGNRPAFDHHNLDYKIWCRQCHRSWAIGRWQCSCGTPWHVCPTHQGEPHRLRTSTTPPTAPTTTTPTPTTAGSPSPAAPSTAATRRTTKRVLGQGRDGSIHNWLDQPATKRSRPTPAEVELGTATAPAGIKHHLLGPKLRAKFPRLAVTTTPPPPPAEHPANLSTSTPTTTSQPHRCCR